jgi:hypothetical protein
MNFSKIERDAPSPKPVPFTVRYAEVPIEDIKGRIIRNPGYGGPRVSIYGWCWHPEISRHRKPKFQEALRESIRQDGVRNPVVVFAVREGLFISFGGSRVLAARDVGLERIPAVVNDYCGAFEDASEVTPENVESFFTDVPQWWEFTEVGFDTHYFMERNRRGSCDPSGYAWMPKGAEWIAHEFPWLEMEK